MIDKLSKFNVDIPLVGGAVNKVGSLLQDLVNSMPISDLANEFNVLYSRARSSVAAQGGAFDMSVKLGQMNNVKKYGALLKEKTLSAKYSLFGSLQAAIPVGAKRDLLSKLQTAFPIDTAGLTLEEFNPSEWTQKLYSAYGLDSSFAYSASMSVLDIFGVRPDNEVCEICYIL